MKLKNPWTIAAISSVVAAGALAVSSAVADTEAKRVPAPSAASDNFKHTIPGTKPVLRLAQ